VKGDEGNMMKDKRKSQSLAKHEGGSVRAAEPDAMSRDLKQRGFTLALPGMKAGSNFLP
jgi:hypothetical protein